MAYALVVLLYTTYGDDPIERERREGRWPFGKWKDLTNTNVLQNHELPSHLQQQLGYPFPSARLGHASTMWEYQRKMMLFGGATAGAGQAVVEPLDDLWQFDIDKTEWRELQPDSARPSGRVYHTMFQFHHWTFLFGGATFSGPEWESSSETQEVYGDLWLFDPTIGLQGSWKNITSSALGLPSARHSMSVTSWNGNFFFFGGSTATGASNQLFLYQPDEDTIGTGGSASHWVLLTPGGEPPLARAAHSTAMLHDGNMYLFGGQHNNTYLLGDLWKYHLQANTWTQLESVGCKPNPTGPTGIWHTIDEYWLCGEGPPPRSGHQASPALYHAAGPSPYGAMVVLGGRLGENEYSNSVWVYHPGVNRWQEHSIYCLGSQSSLALTGRRDQCVEHGQHDDRTRPSPRWRFSMAAYHNRTEVSAYHGTQLYLFGGVAGTYGGWLNMDVTGTAAHGLGDLWAYHV